ncbi:MAG: GC-type dockerin domain-anchored protein [Phycisphaerales bacterium JB040]
MTRNGTPRFHALSFAAATLTGAAPALASDVTAPSRPVGINLAPAVDYQTAWTFVDIMKTAREWLPQTSEAPGGPWNTGAAISTDANGWPNALADGQAVSTLMCREIDGRYPGGRYVCLYEGNGFIDFAFDARVVSRAPGRIELDVTPSEDGVFMTIKETDPNDHIRNVRVIMPGFEDSYEEHPFHPDFLETLSPFTTLRFMDWGSTNNSRIERWSERPTPARYTQQARGGVALEHMIKLCNELNADGWFCVPHRADDDYVRNMAQTIADQLEPGRKAYIEYSNEVWNSMFTQYDYASQKGRDLGLATEPWVAAWRYTGYRSKQVFDIVDDYLPSNRLVRVLPGQAAVTEVLKQALSIDGVAEATDAIAIAPYFSGPASEPENYPGVLGWSNERVLDSVEDHITTVTGWVNQHATLANQHGVELIGYEGGQHLVPPPGTGAIDDPLYRILILEANRNPRMRNLYYQFLNSWHAAGGTTICLFNHVSEPTKWGHWGLLEFQDQPWYEAHKWSGVVKYLYDNDSFNNAQDAPLNPDVDGDGVLTNNDLATFVGFFTTLDPAADFNRDGVIDGKDIADFVAAFVGA